MLKALHKLFQLKAQTLRKLGLSFSCLSLILITLSSPVSASATLRLADINALKARFEQVSEDAESLRTHAQSLEESNGSRRRYIRRRIRTLKGQVQRRQAEADEIGEQLQALVTEHEAKLREEAPEETPEQARASALALGDIEYMVEQDRIKRAEEAAAAAEVLRLEREREEEAQRQASIQFAQQEYEHEQQRQEQARVRAAEQLAQQEAEQQRQAEGARLRAERLANETAEERRQRVAGEQLADLENKVFGGDAPAPAASGVVTTEAPDSEALPAADSSRIGEQRPVQRPPIEERTHLKLSDILIEPYGDFNVLPNRRGASEIRIRTTGRNNNHKVRIVGERNGMYVIHIYKDQEKIPGSYFISKRWAHRSLNMQAALTAVELNRVARTAGVPSEIECVPGDEPVQANPVTIEEVRELEPQAVVSTSSASFKPGCEVLEGGVGMNDRESLSQCFSSIKASIARGARGSNGQLSRTQLFCNMYKNLRPEEQHFAGMMMTSIGEAGIIAKSRSTADPKYQEQLFVMKTMDNRLRQAKADKGRSDLNGLDIALAPSQFSMYNSSIFPDFRSLFEPGSSVYARETGTAISAYMSFYNESEKLEPRSSTADIGMYYNPHGMRRISSMRSSVRERERAKVRRLKAQGKLPANHPNDRKAPNWDFDTLEPVNDLSFDGVGVKKTAPFMHVFYAHKNGRPYYGPRNKMPPPWRDRCAN